MSKQVEKEKLPAQPQSDVIRVIISSVGEDQRLAFSEQEHKVEPFIAPLSFVLHFRSQGKYAFSPFVRATSLWLARRSQ